MNYTRTKTAFSYQGSIADGASEQEEFVALGNFLITGLIDSSQDLSLTIEEGIDQKTKTYIKKTTIEIQANAVKTIEHAIFGSYCKVSLSNASGSAADVKSLLVFRDKNLMYTGRTTPQNITTIKKLETLETNTTAINASNTYTSSWFSVQEYEQLTGMVTTDQDGSFKIEFSHDSSVTLAEDTDTYSANEKKGFTSPVVAKYARFSFTNTSASNQTSFSYVFYGRN